MQKNDPNQKRYLGKINERRVLRIIKSLRNSKTHHATQSELISRTNLDLYVMRQILRRLRRRHKVEVSFLPGIGNKKVRVYT